MARRHHSASHAASAFRGAASLAVSAALLGSPAFGGGLGVREQSAFLQGASFAGAAAGGGLGSSYWNPAAISNAAYGTLTESHFALIQADYDVYADTISVLPGSALGTSTTLANEGVSIDPLVVVGSSYGARRISDDVVLGISITAPFGAKNKADTAMWSGQYHYRSSNLLTVNANPIVSYQLTPSLSVAAGPQIQYLALALKANPSGGFAPPQTSSMLEGDDVGFGATAGLLWQPSPATSIGLGYRSAVAHKVEGDASMANGLLTTGTMLGTVAFSPVDFAAKLETPEMVTLSVRQSIDETVRLLATVEWTNWSRLDTVDFKATRTGGIAAMPFAVGQSLNVLDFHWDDGWFFAAGAEWDYAPRLTFRAGAAYEISPIRDADQRKINIADSNRLWLSAGASYTLSETMAVDIAYTHIFFDDAPIVQHTTSPGSATTPVREFRGHASQDANIVAMALKSKW